MPSSIWKVCFVYLPQRHEVKHKVHKEVDGETTEESAAGTKGHGEMPDEPTRNLLWLKRSEHFGIDGWLLLCPIACYKITLMLK
jgi:hypothetical protein